MSRGMEYWGLTTDAVRIACYYVATLGVDQGIERSEFDEIDVACRQSLHAGERVRCGDIVPGGTVRASPW